MAVAVVLQSVTSKPDGYVYVVGTVAGGPPVTATILLSDLAQIPLANIQNFLALQLIIASGQQVVIASLAGTVNF